LNTAFQEIFMRKAILGIATVAGFTASFFVGTATAEGYRWCAHYGLRGGGGANCGFVTLAQCQATVSGIGGFCAQNQFYTGPERTVRYKRQRHQD
jgi:hypothetical protein